LGFRKIKYNIGANIVEIKIRDETGKYVENWTIMMPDLMQWVSIMKKKYGFSDCKRDSNLDWAL